MRYFHYCLRRAERRKGAFFHSVQLSKSSHHAHAIPGQTMATHGQDSQSTAPSDRPTVQNNSLLDTLPWNKKSTRGWLRTPTSSVHLASTLTQMC
ncbi:hypothetical protein D6C77_03861 [Aureobasidium pullulans]|uniref:Uncharacterized protein n=1 Tax=Aureobasidium pullulans TaxID=5580 RepID=A0AB74JLT5_AURPU|nr:hypothetical protein D6D12_07684 [Aureobasidium pullulans]THX53530.1 hypothetical protein D6D11_04430 [Aureobasidium pullulans]TIA60834.1 hypothetical protein D6C77_03861 [Aureobasidium pullulans]